MYAAKNLESASLASFAFGLAIISIVTPFAAFSICPKTLALNNTASTQGSMNLDEISPFEAEHRIENFCFWKRKSVEGNS